jgi:hypothetical protein
MTVLVFQPCLFTPWQIQTGGCASRRGPLFPCASQPQDGREGRDHQEVGAKVDCQTGICVSH